MSEIKMKKVLILAYDFPPYVSVGGLRPYNWYRYFKEFDIEPIVVTRQWGNDYGNELDYIAPSRDKGIIIEKSDLGTVIRTPYEPNLANRILLRHGDQKLSVIRRMISAFYEFGQFLLPIGPKRKLYLAAKSYLKNQQVDYIIATGDPFILFKYAKDLSTEFHTPWIADYRDPWTTNKTNFISRYVKPWNWFFERRIVRKANIITTVDVIFKRKIIEIVGNQEVHVLPNGFDPEVVNKVQYLLQESDKLRIAFVGTLYPWHPIESFLSIFNELILSHPDRKAEINFYGINNPHTLTLLLEEHFPQLTAHVNIKSRLPNHQLLPLLATNHVMLLFNYYAYTGTKIYDYLGIRRKILLCFTDEPEAEKLKTRFYNIEEVPSDNLHIQADILNETTSGIAVRDKQHLKETLDDLYQEFSDTGQIECNSHGIEKYSRKIQVEKLAELLASIQPLASIEPLTRSLG